MMFTVPKPAIKRTFTFNVDETRLSREGALIIDFKTDKEQNGHRNGWFCADSYANGIIRLFFDDINPRKPIRGVKIEDSEIVVKLDALHAKLLNERKADAEAYKAELLAGTGKVLVMEVGVDFPHLAVYPDADVEKKIGYTTAYDTLNQALCYIMRKTITEKIEQRTYTVNELRDAAPESMKFLAENEAEKKRRAEIFTKAKETGMKQLIDTWSEECSDENEECDIDQVSLFALPDGKTETKYQHTW